ncbi:uncharacterized protein TNCV_1789811 [Trichonephila clavipes]|nr:uncharacterized protein TNCV_1789811 [Trichonephila clavipes]
MGEALNTTSLSICRTMCESGHLLEQCNSNVLSCCRPPTTYWFLNLGNDIKVTGSDPIHCDIPSPSENGYFDWYWARTHDRPAMIRYLDRWATAAQRFCGRSVISSSLVPLSRRVMHVKSFEDQSPPFGVTWLIEKWGVSLDVAIVA